MVWSCHACTFDNSNDGALMCDVCETHRVVFDDDDENNDDDRDEEEEHDKEGDVTKKEDAVVSQHHHTQYKLNQQEEGNNKKPPIVVASNVSKKTTATTSTSNMVQQTLFGTRAVPVDKNKTKKKKSDSNNDHQQTDKVVSKKRSRQELLPVLNTSETTTTTTSTASSTTAAINNHGSSTSSFATTFGSKTTTWKQRAHHVMTHVFGISSLRGLQPHAIKCACQGQSQLLVMATGAGKSLCYQLPAIVLGGTTLVISPLIALMQDQVRALQDRQIDAVMLASCQTERHNQMVLERLVGRRLNSSSSQSRKKQQNDDDYKKPITLLYCTPEQVKRHQFRSILQELYQNTQKHNANNHANSQPQQTQHLRRLSLIAIDEAHCVSTWGHDFRPAYRELGWLREALPLVPLMACTATATPHVVSDIQQSLGLVNAPVHMGRLDRPNIFYRVAYVDAILLQQQQATSSSSSAFSGDDAVLAHFVNHVHKLHASFEAQQLPCAGIIYCRKREHTVDVARYMNQNPTSSTNNKIRAVAYHAGLSAKDRLAAQDGWTSGTFQVVVATTAFGMGIDLSHVRYVVHWCMSQSVEAFYQESGRAGRDSEPAHSLLYLRHDDVKTLRYIVSQDKNQQLVPHKLAALEKMVDYAMKPHCRRQYLLQHFGVAAKDSNPAQVCQGKCDYCVKPKKVQRALEQVAAAQQYNPFQVRQPYPRENQEWDGQWKRPHGDESDDDDLDHDTATATMRDGLGITTSSSDVTTDWAGEEDESDETKRPAKRGPAHVQSTLAKYEAIELQQNQRNGFVHFKRKGSPERKSSSSLTASSHRVKVPEHFRTLLNSRTSTTTTHTVASKPPADADDAISSATYASQAERLRAELQEIRAKQEAAKKKQSDSGAS